MASPPSSPVRMRMQRGQVQDEDLAVADLPGPRPGDDRVDRRLDERLVDGDLQLDLAQQAAGLLVAAVDLGDALLPAPADHVAHGHQVDLLLGRASPGPRPAGRAG